MENPPVNDDVSQEPTEPMKIGVVGSRDWDKREILGHYLDTLRDSDREVIIVTGTLPNPNLPEDSVTGADQLAVLYAKQHGLSCVVHEADWKTYGLRAGPQRNTLIAQDAHMVVAFWDEKSKGTRDILTKAAKRGIPTWVVTETGEEYQYPKNPRIR